MVSVSDNLRTNQIVLLIGGITLTKLAKAGGKNDEGINEGLMVLQQHSLSRVAYTLSARKSPVSIADCSFICNLQDRKKLG